MFSLFAHKKVQLKSFKITIFMPKIKTNLTKQKTIFPPPETTRQSEPSVQFANVHTEAILRPSMAKNLEPTIQTIPNIKNLPPKPMGHVLLKLLS